MRWFLFAIFCVFALVFTKCQGATTEQRGDDADDSSTGSDARTFNFASQAAGAIIIDKSPASGKGYSQLLNDDKDKYSISPCEEKKWVVIGLSEDILVTSIVMANYEKYSSMLKDFQLLASNSYPTTDWTNLGYYTALPKLGEQKFNVTHTEGSHAHTRYLKIKFNTHYSDETLCTLSQIKVHGITAIASFKQEVEQSDSIMRDMIQQLSSETNKLDEANLREMLMMEEDHVPIVEENSSDQASSEAANTDSEGLQTPDFSSFNVNDDNLVCNRKSDSPFPYFGFLSYISNNSSDSSDVCNFDDNDDINANQYTKVDNSELHNTNNMDSADHTFNAESPVTVSMNEQSNSLEYKELDSTSTISAVGDELPITDSSSNISEDFKTVTENNDTISDLSQPTDEAVSTHSKGDESSSGVTTVLHSVDSDIPICSEAGEHHNCTILSSTDEHMNSNYETSTNPERDSVVQLRDKENNQQNAVEECSLASSSKDCGGLTNEPSDGSQLVDTTNEKLGEVVTTLPANSIGSEKPEASKNNVQNSEVTSSSDQSSDRTKKSPLDSLKSNEIHFANTTTEEKTASMIDNELIEEKKECTDSADGSTHKNLRGCSPSTDNNSEDKTVVVNGAHPATNTTENSNGYSIENQSTNSILLSNNLTFKQTTKCNSDKKGFMSNIPATSPVPSYSKLFYNPSMFPFSAFSPWMDVCNVTEEEQQQHNTSTESNSGGDAAVSTISTVTTSGNSVRQRVFGALDLLLGSVSGGGSNTISNGAANIVNNSDHPVLNNTINGTSSTSGVSSEANASIQLQTLSIGDTCVLANGSSNASFCSTNDTNYNRESHLNVNASIANSNNSTHTVSSSAFSNGNASVNALSNSNATLSGTNINTNYSRTPSSSDGILHVNPADDYGAALNATTAASIASNCFELLRFSEFQTKMISRLQRASNSNGLEDNSSAQSSGGEGGNSNVFRLLMQRIKTLERNNAIVETYATQLSECYRQTIRNLVLRQQTQSVSVNDTLTSIQQKLEALSVDQNKANPKSRLQSIYTPRSAVRGRQSAGMSRRSSRDPSISSTGAIDITMITDGESLSSSTSSLHMNTNNVPPPTTFSVSHDEASAHKSNISEVRITTSIVSNNSLNDMRNESHSKETVPMTDTVKTTTHSRDNSDSSTELIVTHAQSTSGTDNSTPGIDHFNESPNTLNTDVSSRSSEDCINGDCSETAIMMGHQFNLVTARQPRRLPRRYRDRIKSRDSTYHNDHGSAALHSSTDHIISDDYDPQNNRRSTFHRQENIIYTSEHRLHYDENNNEKGINNNCVATGQCRGGTIIAQDDVIVQRKLDLLAGKLIVTRSLVSGRRAPALHSLSISSHSEINNKENDVVPPIDSEKDKHPMNDDIRNNHDSWDSRQSPMLLSRHELSLFGLLKQFIVDMCCTTQPLIEEHNSFTVQRQIPNISSSESYPNIKNINNNQSIQLLSLDSNNTQENNSKLNMSEYALSKDILSCPSQDWCPLMRSTHWVITGITLQSTVTNHTFLNNESNPTNTEVSTSAVTLGLEDTCMNRFEQHSCSSQYSDSVDKNYVADSSINTSENRNNDSAINSGTRTSTNTAQCSTKGSDPSCSNLADNKVLDIETDSSKKLFNSNSSQKTVESQKEKLTKNNPSGGEIKTVYSQKEGANNDLVLYVEDMLQKHMILIIGVCLIATLFSLFVSCFVSCALIFHILQRNKQPTA